jgi:conjugal transfer/type IV secretion protein DotA/TraY
MEVGLETFADNDLSAKLLTQILGQGWATGDILSPAPNLIIEMLYRFNEVLAMFAVIIVTVTLLQGVMGTAADGTPLGKKFSTLWTPIRGAIGIGMVMPVKGGLCGMQMLVLMLIAYSCQFANTLHYSALDYMATNDMQFSNAYIAPDRQQEVEKIAKAVWVSGVTQQLLALQKDGELDKLFNLSIEQKHDAFDYIYFKNMHDADNKANTPASFITATIVSERNALNSDGQRSKIILDLAGDILILLTKVFDEHYADFAMHDWNQDEISKIRLEYLDIIKKYTNELEELDKVFIAEKRHRQVEQGASDSFLSDIKNGEAGWITAGTIYLALLDEQMQVRNSLDTGSRVKEANIEHIYKEFGGGSMLSQAEYFRHLTSVANFTIPLETQRSIKKMMDEYEYNQKNAFQKFGISTKSFLVDAKNVLFWTSPAAIATKYVLDDDFANDLKNTVKDAKNSAKMKVGEMVNEHLGVIFTATGTVANNPNPILAIMQSGTKITNTTMKMIGGIMALKVLDDMTPGFSVSSITSFVLLIAGAALYVGIVFMVWIPLVPFMLWFWQVIAWILTCVEALVAAPLWAVAHSMPEGDGFAGQHARQGYMLVAHVMLRPALMIIGFYIALYLCQFIFVLVGVLFFNGIGAYYNTTFSLNGFVDIFSAAIVVKIALVVISCILVLTTTTKIFSLISILPENLMRWLGQHIQGFGVEADADRSQGQMKSVMGRVGGIASQAANTFHAPKLKMPGGGGGGRMVSQNVGIKTK